MIEESISSNNQSFTCPYCSHKFQKTFSKKCPGCGKLPNNINKLPAEIYQHHIFPHLNRRDILTARQVCRYWSTNLASKKLSGKLIKYSLAQVISIPTKTNPRDIVSLPNGLIAIPKHTDIEIIDLNTYKQIKVLSINAPENTPESHRHSISCLAVLPNNLLAAASCNGRIRIWDLTTYQCTCVLLTQNERISHIIPLSTNMLAAISYSNPRIHIYDLERMLRVCILDNHDCDSLHEYYFRDAISILPNNQLALATRSGQIKIWNWQTKQRIVLGGEGNLKWASTMKTLQNGFLAYTLHDAFTDHADIIIWDPQTKKNTMRLIGHTGNITNLTQLPNGLLVSSSLDKTIRVWKPETGECIKILTEHTHWVTGLLSPTNNILVSASQDGTIRIWDTQTWERLKVLEYKYGIKTLIALSQNRFASFANDNHLTIWKGETLYDRIQKRSQLSSTL